VHGDHTGYFAVSAPPCADTGLELHGRRQSKGLSKNQFASPIRPSCAEKDAHTGLDFQPALDDGELRRHAGRKAVETAAGSLRDLRVAEVTKMDMKVDNGKVTAFRTRVALSFKYETE
jgi:flavin-binding protein dodecin